MLWFPHQFQPPPCWNDYVIKHFSPLVSSSVKKGVLPPPPPPPPGMPSVYSDASAERRGWAEVGSWQEITLSNDWIDLRFFSLQHQTFVLFRMTDPEMLESLCVGVYVWVYVCRCVLWHRPPLCWTVCHRPEKRRQRSRGADFAGVLWPANTQTGKRAGLSVTGGWREGMSCQDAFVFPH